MLEKTPGISGSIHHGYLQPQFPDLHLRFPHAFISSHRVQLQQRIRRRLARKIGISSAEGRLHHAAGISKDNSRAGGLAHQGIIGGILQGIPINALCLGPPCQLPGGHHLVGIPHSCDTVILRGSMHLLPADFKLFGGTGSQCNMDNALRIQAHLLGKIGFDRRTLHSDGTLCRREMREQFRCIELRKMHPSGTAAGKLGKRSVLLRYPANQLAGFLHNGEVRSKVGIQHIVHTEGPKQCHHFPFHERTGFHSEFFAQRCPNCGRGADHHNFIGVRHRLADLRAFVPLGNAVHRTDIGALSAINTDCLSASLLQCIRTVYPHQIGTGIFAHAAPDTLLLPAHDAGIVRLNGNADRQRLMSQFPHIPFC